MTTTVQAGLTRYDIGRSSFRRPPIAVIVAGALLAVIVLAAVFAPLVAPHAPNAIDPTDTFASPSAAHLLGTDSAGRDVLSRLIFGARSSLLGAVMVSVMAAIAGIALGSLAGYVGGPVDAVLARLFDLLLALPSLLLAIVIVAVLGGGLWPATVAVTVGYVPLLARVARAAVIVERRKPYVLALKVQGTPGWRILLGHILPNVAQVVGVQAALNFGYALLDLAGLAFLGLGAQPPTADWGQMLNSGRAALTYGSYTEVLSASIAVTLSVVAFNVVTTHFARRQGALR